MDEDLISKKDLLEQTGISYGQLYRWKRKNLIPEDWFIRKSTFTGQETFFPRERILERIEKIQAMKENLSLDELAEMFAPGGGQRISKADMLKRGIVSDFVLSIFTWNKRRRKNRLFHLKKCSPFFYWKNFCTAGRFPLRKGKCWCGSCRMRKNLLQQKAQRYG